MTFMILSEENHRHAKAALHAELPHVRSSHLAEAMAAGFGRGSHAALLSFRRGYQDHRAPLARWDGAAFARRIASFGYADVPATAFGTALAAMRLPHAPYVKFRKGDRSANEDHYRTANRLGRPMMMITTARTYAQLEWDCITIDGREDHHVRGDEGNRLVRVMFEMFQTRCRCAPGKPLFCGSAFTGTIKKLLPETAGQLAEDYFTLLYAPLTERPVGIA